MKNKYSYFVNYKFAYVIGGHTYKDESSEVFEIDFKVKDEESFNDLSEKVSKYICKSSSGKLLVISNVVLLDTVIIN